MRGSDVPMRSIEEKRLRLPALAVEAEAEARGVAVVGFAGSSNGADRRRKAAWCWKPFFCQIEKHRVCQWLLYR